jgi:RNA polymerase sigma-70 factor (ECF subfamily)
MDERIHIARLKAGDLTGLEKLVTEYQVRAVHAAWLIVYDRALAEEIAQSAFIKAAERIGQYDEGRPFAPWFFRIVINDALKAARKQKRQLSLDDNLADLAAWLIDPGQSPEQIVA